MNAEINTIKTNISTGQVSSHVNEWYSADDVIRAYEDGKNAHRAKAMKQYEKAIKTAQQLCENFLEKLEKDIKVKCKEIHLKIDKASEFTAIYIIPEKAFLSFEKFSEIALLSANYSSDNRTEKLDFLFLFMPRNKSVNETALQADGYTWIFKKPKANG